MPFIDFMCGSGTIPVEAAMIAANIPPGALGRTYGFQKWKDYDQDLFREIVNERNRWINQASSRIFASDISPAAVRLAISHAKNARVSELISFRTCHFKDLQPSGRTGSNSD